MKIGVNEVYIRENKISYVSKVSKSKDVYSFKFIVDGCMLEVSGEKDRVLADNLYIKNLAQNKIVSGKKKKGQK